MPKPKVFISYSHDSDEHKSWVLQLAQDLISADIDATLDEKSLRFGELIPNYAQRQIGQSDRVLMICSERYVSRANTGVGGVGNEGVIINAELYENLDSIKFIPVIRNNSNGPKMPTFLGVRRYVDLQEDSKYQSEIAKLIADILRPATIPILDSPDTSS